MAVSKKIQMCLLLMIFLLIFPRLTEPEEPKAPVKKEPALSTSIKNKKNPTGFPKESIKKESVLHIQDMEIQTLLKALAMKNQVNIISTPQVKGKISLNLNNATLEETLTAITKSMGLSWLKEGSVYIVSKGNVKEENDKTIKIVESFQINYADLKALSKIIQWSFPKSKTISYDNKQILLIEAQPQEFPEIKRLIDSLDIPPKQALIEAQILEINLSDDTSFGPD